MTLKRSILILRKSLVFSNKKGLVEHVPRISIVSPILGRLEDYVEY